MMSLNLTHNSKPIPPRPIRTWWGKRRIDALEILGQTPGENLTRRRRKRELVQASADVAPLGKWGAISQQSYDVYTRGPNLVRLKRLVDHVPPRSRLLDIGIGYGYVTGVLLRDTEPAYYCGVDLKDTYLEATRKMIKANELDPSPVELEVLDLYEVTSDFLRRHNPDLILLLEVLEHVSDPHKALSTLAAVAGAGTQLLFTVPLYGRLEGVWGHLSLFDRDRLERICDASGLQIDRAEPIANQWAMVVASVLPGETKAREDEPNPEAYSFVTIPTDGDPQEYRRPADEAEVSAVPRRAYIDCEIAMDGGAEGPGQGGIRLPVSAPGIMRLELSLEPPDGAGSLSIRGLTAEGEVKLHWRAGGAGRRFDGTRTTYVLKPGRNSRALRPIGAADPSEVRWLEVVVELDPGERVELKLHRAAYVQRRPPRLTFS
jgi:SAM-dependent methyltransferase